MPQYSGFGEDGLSVLRRSAPSHRVSQKGRSPKDVCRIPHRSSFVTGYGPRGSARASVVDHNIRAACMDIRPAGCRAGGTRYMSSSPDLRIFSLSLTEPERDLSTIEPGA